MIARVQFHHIERVPFLMERIQSLIQLLETELPEAAKLDLALARESVRSGTFSIRARVRGLRGEIVARVQGADLSALLHLASDRIFTQITRMKDRMVTARRLRPRHKRSEEVSSPTD
jgi:ribosome-associated translation inhibitor RaiA